MRKSLLITMLLSFALFSCDDEFYEIKPKGKTESSNFWMTAQDAIAASNSLYEYQTHNHMYGRGFFWYVCASDDMIVGRDKAQSILMKDFTCTGDEPYTKGIWNMHYQVIRRANEIILNVPTIEMDEALKNRILGEAYFMSGLMYFQIAYRYGDQNAGIPILNIENPEENSELTRPANVGENYAYIEDLFEKAAELLPAFDQLSESDRGRAHRHAANAYLAKTYVFHAQYDDQYWAKAVEAADRVINSGNHALVNTGNPDHDFKSVFFIENNWSSEYLWSVVSSTEAGSILPGVMLENTGWGKYNGWGYFHPTLELYESFEEGDKRREATILKFGDEFTYFGEERQYFSVNNRTGFQFNKYMEPYSYPGGIHLNPNDPSTDLNVPLMRYAEVLLLKSEALIQQGLNGDEPLNQVRQRAGLEPISGATLEQLKNERRCELAGEWSDRHFDLVRWGDAKEAYHKPLHGRVHQDLTDPNSPYEVKEVWQARTNFDPNVHHVWPIPPHEIANSNGKIAQNSGW
ncbi:RagB/SusD family nutrient uptake outer membrane protein [Aureibacter tunicatorum]|uniref:RagB/SusD family nutrient uptake outer membrane protein n=1 Tax=Aureibacter tunicatorum TaxID=866807 RepID=A0AAE4BSE1_9BACT|nr:RagB/SusD family nutrient uptake outer membrane protein [Aureibacter tunicatorum]MDR6238765.1 hypothetical protein [Aureibacter tunicatorum]BDD05304.1 membrane protein [Aureibacter tunicatorum]